MRLFIAIDFPEEINSYLKEIQKQMANKIYSSFNEPVQKTGYDFLKLVSSFHLTLRFIGEKTENHKKAIISCLQKISFNKFSLELNSLGAFPNKSNIRVIWVGISPSKPLEDLHNNIEKALSDFRLKKDFNFLPHITLARIKRGKPKIQLPGIKIAHKKFYVNNFALYKSTLSYSGPIYEKIIVFK